MLFLTYVKTANVISDIVAHNKALHATGDGVWACTGFLWVAARRAARLSASPRSATVVLPRRVNAVPLGIQKLMTFTFLGLTASLIVGCASQPDDHSARWWLLLLVPFALGVLWLIRRGLRSPRDTYPGGGFPDGPP